MSQELLEAIKKRQKKMEGVELPEQKPMPKSEISVQHNPQGFNKNKAMLQNLLEKKQQPEAPSQEIKKEEPKGDQQNFSNAKNMLQQQFGKGGNTNVLNVQTLTGIPNLPPPPPPPSMPLGNLPLPPPPPPINIANLPPPPPPLDLSPPPLINLPPRPNNLLEQSKPQNNTNFNQTHHLPPPPPSQIPSKPQQSQDDALFILNQGTSKSKALQTQQSTKPSISAQDEKQMQKAIRKKDIDKRNPKKFPLTQQFFGINIAGLIKKQFVKSANIPSNIGLEVRKKQYQINFPTIENKQRAIQPIQTLYADTQSLDLVSCFMNKNLNAAKVHNEQREQFLKSFTNYNWEIDPLKLKGIRQATKVLPNSTFVEPNFVAIKNATIRCNDIIQALSKNQQYLRCDQLKKLIVSTEKKLSQYCSNPQNNRNLLQQIEENVYLMKNVTI